MTRITLHALNKSYMKKNARISASSDDFGKQAEMMRT